MKFSLRVNKRGIIFKKFDFAQINVDERTNYKLIRGGEKHTFEVLSNNETKFIITSDGLVNREFEIFSSSDFTKWSYFYPSFKKLIKSESILKLHFENKEFKIDDRGDKLIIRINDEIIGNVKLISKKFKISTYTGLCSNNVYEREILICLVILVLKNEIYQYINE